MRTGETLLQGTAAIAANTPLWNLLDGTLTHHPGGAEVTFYFRESFGLWKHGWLALDGGIWRVAREHLTILACEKIKKQPALTLTPANPAPTPPVHREEQADEDFLWIFKAFMKLNQVK